MQDAGKKIYESIVLEAQNCGFLEWGDDSSPKTSLIGMFERASLSPSGQKLVFSKYQDTLGLQKWFKSVGVSKKYRERYERVRCKECNEPSYGRNKCNKNNS